MSVRMVDAAVLRRNWSTGAVRIPATVTMTWEQMLTTAIALRMVAVELAMVVNSAL